MPRGKGRKEDIAMNALHAEVEEAILAWIRKSGMKNL